MQLWGGKTTDISAIGAMPKMRYLDLRYNQVTDVTPLRNLTELETLLLEGNRVADIAPVAGIASLRELGLSGNVISEIPSLSRLVNLGKLELSGNRLRTIGGLLTAPKSAMLFLAGNHLPLSELKLLMSHEAVRLLNQYNVKISTLPLELSADVPYDIASEYIMDGAVGTVSIWRVDADYYKAWKKEFDKGDDGRLPVILWTDDKAAVPGEDFTLGSAGTLVFLKPGYYVLGIANPSVFGHGIVPDHHVGYFAFRDAVEEPTTVVSEFYQVR